MLDSRRGTFAARGEALVLYLGDIRREYALAGLDVAEVDPDPIRQDLGSLSPSLEMDAKPPSQFVDGVGGFLGEVGNRFRPGGDRRLVTVQPQDRYGLRGQISKSPRQDFPQMSTKPRNLKVSGLLRPRFSWFCAAKRPNSISRVLSG